MTTHAGTRNAESHQLTQRFARAAEDTNQACEASLLQMSGTPFQNWTYFSDDRYTNAGAHTSDEDRQGQTAVSNPPYPAQGPPRFLFPDGQSHETTVIQNASHPRLSVQGRDWHNAGDPNYRFPSITTGSLAQYSMQRPSVSGSVEHAGPSSSYYDVSSRSRGSVGSAGRLNDVDSQ
ncbi:hypothetical protein BDW59DRAFT_158957 [Aspergillus cavernicola]|uniref:Uncharacterized protein n=1 Tax=Aspergillus cavernicola TaxID=176166 RepID=A0ABR4IQB6_9EURO